MKQKLIQGMAMGVVLAAAIPLSPIFARHMTTSQTDISAASGKSAPDAQQLRAMETSLRRDILDAWYPRAVDSKNGGFQQTFAADWELLPDDKRGVVYQSRLTWVAAQAALRAPEGSAEAKRWQETALHGLDYLSSALWDKENGGGFFFEITPDGKPDTDRKGEKHAYGAAFGIYASCAVYEATRDDRALELARRAFDHLEKYAHDGKNGGYTEALSRDNKPILRSTVAGQNDPIGTPYGYKSMNTHIHLLEAFTALYTVDKSPAVRKRLEETFLIVRDKVAVEPGCLNLYLTPDWRAVPGHDSFGHDVETAFLLTEAAHVLGNHDERTRTISRSLVDHALEYGWDATNGGFYDEGTAFGKPTVTKKVWWTQAEGLNALLLMHREYGAQTPRYKEAFDKQWDFIARHQIDAENAGWRTNVSAEGVADPAAQKSDFWKDPYHQGRALFVVTETLRALEKQPAAKK
ncbi:MAG: AGE family epimerase/isomerase [Akkermansiaceae bacterium]|nr:AGE family epimerase/isomerase [Armatimonadota bacterium]